MFEIIIDATSDLEEKYKKEVSVVPLYIMDSQTNEKIAVERDYSIFYKNEELVEKWYKGKLKTSQPSLDDFLRAIDNSKYDKILIITISSKLSGTYNVAVNASKKSEKEVVVFDSQNASIGAGIYIKKAIEMRNKGYDVEQVIEELKKLDVRLYLAVDDIDYLLKNGRINRFKYAFLKLTKLVPIITVKNGSLELLKLSKNPLDDLKNIEKDLVEIVWGTTKIDSEMKEKSILGSPIVAVNVGPAYGLAGLPKGNI